MKKLSLLLLFLVPLLTSAATLTVNVDTNGVLKAPTNFFAANSNLMAQSIAASGGSGISGIASNGGSGSLNTFSNATTANLTNIGTLTNSGTADFGGAVSANGGFTVKNGANTNFDMGTITALFYPSGISGGLAVGTNGGKRFFYDKSANIMRVEKNGGGSWQFWADASVGDGGVGRNFFATNSLFVGTNAVTKISQGASNSLILTAGTNIVVIETNGNVTANRFIGDGSGLTGAGVSQATLDSTNTALLARANQIGTDATNNDNAISAGKISSSSGNGTNVTFWQQLFFGSNSLTYAKQLGSNGLFIAADTASMTLSTNSGLTVTMSAVTGGINFNGRAMIGQYTANFGGLWLDGNGILNPNSTNVTVFDAGFGTVVNTIFNRSIQFKNGGFEMWRIDSGSNFIPGTDIVEDIGSSSKRVRDLWYGGTNYIGSNGLTTISQGPSNSLIIAAGTNRVIVETNGNITAYKFYGDGSALTGIAGGPGGSSYTNNFPAGETNNVAVGNNPTNGIYFPSTNVIRFVNNGTNSGSFSNGAFRTEGTIVAQGTITGGSTIAVGSTFIGANQVSTTSIGLYSWNGRSAFYAPYDGAAMFVDNSAVTFKNLFLGSSQPTNTLLQMLSGPTPTLNLRDGTTNQWANFGAGITTLTYTNGGTNVSNPGLVITNSTPAISNGQQVAAIKLSGNGWKTTATAASQPVEWQMKNVPVQGSANPSSVLVWESIINGGTPTTNMTLTSGSALGNITSISAGGAAFNVNFQGDVSARTLVTSSSITSGLGLALGTGGNVAWVSGPSYFPIGTYGVSWRNSGGTDNAFHMQTLSTTNITANTNISGFINSTYHINIGQTAAAITNVLPTALPGRQYSFVVQTNNALWVQATNATIRYMNNVTTNSGFISSTNIGSCAHVFCISTNEWYIDNITQTNGVPTWSFQ
jgi:hypothetical protein